MKKDSGQRVNIIGAGEIGYATVVDLDKNNIHNVNSSFWGCLRYQRYRST